MLSKIVILFLRGWLVVKHSLASFWQAFKDERIKLCGNRTHIHYACQVLHLHNQLQHIFFTGRSLRPAIADKFTGKRHTNQDQPGDHQPLAGGSGFSCQGAYPWRTILFLVSFSPNKQIKIVRQNRGNPRPLEGKQECGIYFLEYNLGMRKILL